MSLVLRRTAPLLLTALLLLASASSTRAGQTPVTLDAAITAPSADAATKRVLRDTLTREIATVDFGNTRYRGHYVVSGALIRLHRTETNGKRTSCVVGLALRDARDTLVASIRGNATVETESGDESSLDALAAAAHSAVSRLPEAVRESERK